MTKRDKLIRWALGDLEHLDYLHSMWQTAELNARQRGEWYAAALYNHWVSMVEGLR